MHIKPYAVLGVATACAAAALAVIVTTTEPAAAEPAMRGLFWLALFLTVWGLAGTLLSAARRHLALALSVGLVWAVAVTGWSLVLHRGHAGPRLSGAVFLATMLISFVLFWRLRRTGDTHD